MNGKIMENIVRNYNERYREKRLGVWLDLSTYCNAACPQCHRTNPNGLNKAEWLPLVQWSFEEFKKYFPESTLRHIKYMDICGTWGDPIMNKDIFKIVEYIIKANDHIQIGINTNGSIRDSNWWWDLGLLGGKRIKVIWAIEGITQEQHSKYRQKTNLNLILENMESFSLAQGLSQVFTVVFKHNEKSLYDIAKLVKSHGAEGIIYTKSNRFWNGSGFEFYDEFGNQDILEESNLSKDIFGKVFDLNDDHHMKRIYDETIKCK
jgi:MoaA/NifB/PqqE/SkfB family radical SAM enzyme